MPAAKSEKKQNAAQPPPPNYYAFGQRAEKLIGLQLGYDGSVQARKRAADTLPPTGSTQWVDQAEYSASTVIPGSSLVFSVDAVTSTMALATIEFSGWGIPYEPTSANILAASWAFGTNEMTYNSQANAGNQCLKDMAFTFKPSVDSAGNKTALLSWKSGTPPVQGSGSVALDANNLKFTYVVLRLFGTNTGAITALSSLGNDSTGTPVKVLST